MKSMLRIVSTGRLCTTGLLLGCAGCTAINTRQPSLEMSTVSAWAESPRQNIQLPTPLRTVRPVYPFEHKRAGVTAIVRLNCLVDENGSVQSVTAEKVADPSFARPAIDAVKRWTFEPGRRDGVAVPMRVSIPIEFKLEDA